MENKTPLPTELYGIPIGTPLYEAMEIIAKRLQDLELIVKKLTEK